MDVRDLVKQHYGGGNLVDVVLNALAEAGTDVDHLSASDLFPLDQLHAGGMPSTRHALERLSVWPRMRLLDVGCGIGGPARLAATYNAQVTGIDLTPEFVAAATDLTERVGLAHRATFVATPGESLPFEDGSFDGALMVHVGMNVPDKRAVFAEVHRVLAPSGRFALYEQVRTSDGDLPYPLPWAEDERSSFVETMDEYSAHLEGAGFTVEEVEDRTPAALVAPDGAVSPMDVFGPAFAERIGNNVQAVRAGLLSAVLIIARA